MITEKNKEFAPAIAPEDALTSKQKDNIIDVLGLPDEALSQIGTRQIQQQLEEQIREGVESATTLGDLDTVEKDLSIIPTKSGIKRLRREIQEKRKKLNGVE